MSLVTSNTPGKIHSPQKKLEGAASAARKFERSNVGTMAGSPLPSHIYFRRAAVAARWTKFTKLDPLA